MKLRIAMDTPTHIHYLRSIIYLDIDLGSARPWT